MASMETTIEELDGNRVRLRVEVPSNDVKHAVDHAASDLAGAMRIPGFRKGKVPLPVLLARVGRERLMSEAVESHIGGWFWNAAATSRVRPVEQPQYGYELPESSDDSFRFTATFAVQPKPELADWKELEVPALDPQVPQELVEAELEALRRSVAELVPVERPAQEGDTLVVDLVDGQGEEAQRDYVVELGAGRLLEELESALVGMTAGELTQVDVVSGEGETRPIEVTVKDIKEPVLPATDDELAKAASEFETLAELRAEIESRLREHLEADAEAEFRQAAVDKLAEASNVEVAAPLVDSRTAELLDGFLRSLQRRGLSGDTYLRLTGQTAEQLSEQLRDEASRSLAREIMLEAVADQLGIDVSDEELEAFVREQAEEADDNPAPVLERIREAGRLERLRDDLRLRKALDRIAADVKRIPVELARAREKLWTPGQEKPEGVSKLWTPGSKER